MPAITCPSPCRLFAYQQTLILMPLQSTYPVAKRVPTLIWASAPTTSNYPFYLTSGNPSVPANYVPASSTTGIGVLWNPPVPCPVDSFSHQGVTTSEGYYDVKIPKGTFIVGA